MSASDNASRSKTPDTLAMTGAFAWGLAEATLFFIVPDVLLTWLALHNQRSAWRACFWALTGAIIGGLLMYAWGARNMPQVTNVLTHVPAISITMIESVVQDVSNDGAWAMMRGPVNGVPYKIYAAAAGASGVNIAAFVLISIPARLARFLLITAVAVIANRLCAGLSIRGRTLILVFVWLTFYAWYFWQFSR